MRPLVPLFLLAVATAAPGQQQRPPEFSRFAEFTLEGKGAIYSLDLPVDVYRGIERRDLGDLRVQNAAREFVPHALLRPASSERRAAPAVAMQFFALLGAPGKPVEDMTLHVERRPDGTVKAVVSTGERSAGSRRTVAYLIDASAADTTLREMRFEWQPEAEGTSLEVRIEASDDLRSWRRAGSGPLILLRHGDAMLERRSVGITPAKAKYYRVSWRPAQDQLKLTGITATPVDTIAESPRAWLRVEASAGQKPGEYVFEVPTSLPVDRLRFELPQENTVAASTVLIQSQPGSPERHLASFVLYRMEHRGQKLLNPDIEIPPLAERRWILRVDPRGGGLGSGMPVLHAGYVPHRLVFVARGEAPFHALFGNKEAPPAALAVHTIVPGYVADKPLPALAARLGDVRTREIVKPTGVEAARSYAEQLDEKKLWLWGSLILAVLVIVGMALRLTRQMPAPGEPPKPPVPGEQR